MAGRIGEFQPAGAAGKEHDILGVGGGRDIDDAVADLGDAAAGDDGAAEDVNEAVRASLKVSWNWISAPVETLPKGCEIAAASNVGPALVAGSKKLTRD